MISKEKVVNLSGEHWAPLHFEGREGKKQYAISNLGRVLSFKGDPQEARLLSLSTQKGRPAKIRVLFNKGSKNFAVHLLVAEMFVPKAHELHRYVIHLDRNVQNNAAENLRWVTKSEMLRHLSARSDARQVLQWLPNEVHRRVDVKTLHRQYAITNYGRLISFDKTVEQGVVMKTVTTQQGYKIWRYKEGTTTKHQLIHRLVAQYFLQPPSSAHRFVIHVDHCKTNNVVQNLRWATLSEQRQHAMRSEASRANAVRLKEKSRKTGKGNKLTEETVRLIKKMISSEPRPKMKVIARQFGISTMQLHRIKRGENWAWVQ